MKSVTLCLRHRSSISSVKKYEKEKRNISSKRVPKYPSHGRGLWVHMGKKKNFILPLLWGWHMAQSRLLSSLLPSLHQDSMWVNQVWWELVFPYCQEKFRHRWGHWGGTKLRQRVTMVWWPAAIKSKFVVPGTISVPGLNHFELNSRCLMQVTLIYSELSVAWMLRRKL